MLLKTLRPEEQNFHDGLPQHMREVLEGKNVILWEKLLDDLRYSDLGVIDFMKQGVELVGMHDVSPIYPQQMIRASTTPKLLLKTANPRRR